MSSIRKSAKQGMASRAIALAERGAPYVYIQLPSGRVFVIGSRRRALEAIALDEAADAMENPPAW